jgi:hypothetical protein
MTNTPNYRACVAQLTARTVAARAAAAKAIASPETQTAGAVSARLLLAAEILLKGARDVPSFISVTGGNAGEHDEPKAGGMSLPEVQALKKELLEMWDALHFFGEKPIAYAMPRYWDVVVPVLEDLLGCAESALSNNYQEGSLNGALLDQSYEIRTKAKEIQQKLYDTRERKGPRQGSAHSRRVDLQRRRQAGELHRFSRCTSE